MMMMVVIVALLQLVLAGLRVAPRPLKGLDNLEQLDVDVLEEFA